MIKAKRKKKKKNYYAYISYTNSITITTCIKKKDMRQ